MHAAIVGAASAVAKVSAVVVLTAAFAVLGEIIIRRNRRERAARQHLAQHGRAVDGIVRSLAKVSAGKYGSHKVRAQIDYTLDDSTYTHVAAWWPTEAPSLEAGSFIGLLVDPADPTLATVAGSAAPDIERDSLWRWLTFGVFVLTVVLALAF